MAIKFNRLIEDDTGATAVEYGLILALIFVATLGALSAFGASAIGMWNYVSDTMTESVEGAEEEEE